MHGVGEMTTLCRELLASDVSESHLSSAVVLFAEAFPSHTSSTRHI